MKSRFYVTPMHGSGTDVEDPVRTIVNDMIDTTAGEAYQIMDNPKTRVCIVCLWALDATHASLEANPDILVVSELFDDDDDKGTKLEKPYDLDKDLEKKIDDAFDKLTLKDKDKTDKKPEYKVKDRIKILLNSILDEQNENRKKGKYISFGGTKF